MAQKLRTPRDIARVSTAIQKHVVLRSGIGAGRYVPLDLRTEGEHWEHRHASGKALRDTIPRERQGEWTAPKDRPDPVETIEKTNINRLPHLIPIRIGRMAGSPFAFLRGADAVMAWDLAHTPVTGITTVIDGDAHLNNFGLYGTPQRNVVFDLNDFDEATIGYWEWDLKRLAASVNVAGRENGLSRVERLVAVKKCVAAYRRSVSTMEKMGILDVWYAHSYPGEPFVLDRPDPKSQAILDKAVDKAMQQTNAALLRKVGERGVSGAWRLRESPPILTHVDEAIRDQIVEGLSEYAESLPRHLRYMVSRYHVVDVALRVVGVGSVGTRAYLALLFGNDDTDPLFLQIKEASPPVHAPYLPPLAEEFLHDGWRVVAGESILQASTDLLLGWTTIKNKPYYVRQMRNLKGSIPVQFLSGPPFDYYAESCGVVLGRAHARQGAGAIIAGYCGSSDVLDVALARWAERYGDQNEKDYQALLTAVKQGRLGAILNV